MSDEPIKRTDISPAVPELSKSLPTHRIKKRKSRLENGNKHRRLKRKLSRVKADIQFKHFLMFVSISERHK